MLATLLCVLLLWPALPTRAASVTSTWLGGTGNWTDPARWSGATVPQNTASDSFDVAIDGGDSGTSEVTLDSADTIGSLQVSPGDTLVLTPTGRLTLEGNLIENAGEILIHGSGGGYPQSLVADAGTDLSGGGTILLDGGSISGSALVNLDNRIEGWGTIFVRGFENHGVIEANVAGKTLSMPAGVNYGVVRAVAGATGYFDLSGYGFVNRGAVEALDGSFFAQSDRTSSIGGSYSAFRHSTMDLAGGFVGTRFVTDADSFIRFSGGDTPYLEDVILDGQFAGSDIIVSGTITNLGVFSAGLDPHGPATIVNEGHVVLYSAIPYGTGSTLSFTGGGTVTLDAGNYLWAPFRNVDNDMQGTGRISNLLQNGGRIEAAGGVLLVNGSQTDHTGLFAAAPGGSLEMGATVTGSGAWRADGGQIHVTGNVGTTGDIEVLHGGSLVVDTQMSGGNLVVDDTGSLDVRGILRVAGNVDFAGPNNGRWNFGPAASLETIGPHGAAVGDWSDWQSIETAGEDLGLVAAGFASDNFYLPEIVIGPDGRLFFRDHSDNGNRVGGNSEAVYVDTLVFADSLGLLDLNGISLYYNHLVGSVDQIINVAVPGPGAVPEPAAAWLLGAALAFLVAARELRSKAPFPPES